LVDYDQEAGKARIRRGQPFFKSDTDQVGGEAFDVLDAIFADVDDYLDDPQLSETTQGIDEDELRRRVAVNYRTI